VWTVKEPGDQRPSYAAQTQQAIDAWQHAATREGRDPWTRVVLAGDFNASFQGPSTRAHEQTVAMLHEAGMASVYHQVTGHRHGQEQVHTLRWIGPGRIPFEFHCDYLWLSTDLQPTLVGGGVAPMTDWVVPGQAGGAPGRRSGRGAPVLAIKSSRRSPHRAVRLRRVRLAPALCHTDGQAVAPSWRLGKVDLMAAGSRRPACHRSSLGGARIWRLMGTSGASSANGAK
jgi:hypothetical protein